jgi:TP901 family phage tail tape measure protein
MAEEIIQRMGFDTGDSLSNLNALKTALDNLNGSISTVATSLREYNSAGSAFGKSIQDMNAKVDQMLSKFNSLSTVQPPSLTVDTSAALKQIKDLTSEWGRVPKGQASVDFGAAKAALADYVTTNKISNQQVTQAFAGTLANTTPILGQLNTQVGNLKTQYTSLVPAAQQAAGGVMAFMGQIGKIVALRAFLSALVELKQGFTEGIQAAQDFSIKIAQIQGIMDDTSMKMSDVRAAILATSKAFGMPLDQAAQAFYQTMQNQVGGAADSLMVFKEAANLATANNVPLGDSIDVITAAIKGWNLNVDQSKHLSDVFFEAIKIGRFEASDLANTLGRIGPTAHAMGISVEEAMAAVAIMTQQGVKADTAITQLNAVMTALIKPTDALKKLMNEQWGVQNAEQAILKFGGILGLLRELEKAGGGTSDEMAKLTANVRAIRGEMGLMGDNADLAVKAFDRLKTGSEGAAEAAAKLNLESEGGKARVALNNLTLAWEQLGEKMLPIKTTLAQVAGLLINFASSPAAAIVSITAIIGGLTYAVMTYGTAAIGATTATWGLVAAFLATPAGIAVMITLGATMLLAWSGAFDSIEARHKKLIDTITARTQELSKVEIEEVAKRTRVQNDAIDKRTGQMIDVLTRAKVLLSKETATVASENAAIVAMTKDRFNKILDAQKSYIQALVNSEAEGQKKIVAIQEQISNRKQKIADKEFEYSISRFDARRQAFLEEQRAEELLSQAKAKTTQVQSPEDVARVNELLDRAAALNEKATSQAQQQGANYSELNRLHEVGLNIDRQRNVLGEQEINTIKKQTAANADKALKEQQSLEKTAELFKIIEEGNNRKTKAGVDKTTAQWQEGQKKVAEAWEQVFTLMKDRTPQAADMLGVYHLQEQITSQFNALQGYKIQIQAKVNAEQELLTAPSRSLTPEQTQVAKDLDLDTSNLFGSAATKSKELGDELKKVNDQIGATDKDLVNFRNAVTAAFEQLPSGQKLVDLLNITQENTGGPAISQAFVDIAMAAKKLQEAKPGTDEFSQAFGRLSTQLKNFDEAFGKMNWAEKFASSIKPETLDPFRSMVDEAKKIFGEANAQMELKIKAESIEADIEKLKLITEPLRQSIINMNAGLDQTGVTVTSISNGPLPGMVGALGNVEGAAYGVESAMYAIEAAAIQAMYAVMAAEAAGGSQNAAHGGVIRFAAGGMAPQWKDTRPAMLSPGEYVVKDSQAAKFYPQLQAMNAGVTPNFRAAGGPVTTVGDITVNLTGGDNVKQTVRQIGQQLRREIKRGTIKLN